MALKHQPYLPLYVQDVLTDEKLIDCSASSQGVYFRLLCVLHKQSDYGRFLLKQKFKQTDNQANNFAQALVRSLALDFETIKTALKELISAEVLFIEEDYLCQKRMIKDGELSDIRAAAGRKGGKKTTERFKPKGESEKEKLEEFDAFNWLKQNYSLQYEQGFAMEYKKQMDKLPPRQRVKFIKDFNDTVVLEGLKWDSRIILSRLRKYARNWLENEHKRNEKNQDQITMSKPKQMFN